VNTLAASTGRARQYVSKIPGAISGQGGQDQTFSVASALVNGFALNEHDAFALLSEYNQHCSPPWSEKELWHKVQSATKAQHTKPRGHLLGTEADHYGSSISDHGSESNYRPRMGLKEIEFDRQRLEGLAGSAAVDWSRWLWERSPKMPESQNAYSFLKHVYNSGEIIHIFDNMECRSPAASVFVSNPMDCRVPERIEAGGNGMGIWFLCNPVDGEWHQETEKKWSCRSESALTDYRFMVLESDVAPPELWLPFVTRLPARVVAIYTSGGRSIHTLIQIEAHSKEEFTAVTDPIKRPLKKIGGDPYCLSAVRLTRLPGCHRPEKSGFQELLYLNPDPPLCPIADLSAQWPRTEVGE
jgi:hypothetical protein